MWTHHPRKQNGSRPGGRRPGRTLLLLALTLTFIAGCALLPGSGSGDPFADGTNPADMVTVEVSNEFDGDAVIYALWNGDRHRIGFVAAGEQERFQVRWRSPELGFQVELQGGRHFATSPTLMSRRGSIHVRIPSELP